MGILIDIILIAILIISAFLGYKKGLVKLGAKLFAGINEGAFVYFVHSYYLQADNEEDVAATTEYITHIHAAVESGNVYGCQFHPEKSGEVGLSILKNFVSL